MEGLQHATRDPNEIRHTTGLFDKSLTLMCGVGSAGHVSVSVSREHAGWTSGASNESGGHEGRRAQRAAARYGGEDGKKASTIWQYETSLLWCK